MSDPVTAPLGRLLVVDDEIRLMNALRNTLREQGYEVAGVTSGAEALVALRAEPFDLLLTDLAMPQMDGIALLSAAMEIDPHLVGVVMTGHGTIATAVEAMKTGAYDYLLKPFKLNAILPVLTRAMAVRKLRRQNAELQRRVAERTAELETSNRELEAFSYSISHDLHAPLRAIGGFSSVVLRDHAEQLAPDAKRKLQVVVASAERMERLIEGLLRLARLGRQRLDRQPVNVAALVREVRGDVLHAEAGRQIEIRVGELPDCSGDPTLLRQVFANLLSNACKFTRGKEQPAVNVDCRGDHGERIYYVRDNGAGFDMRYAEKLFGAFQRLHAAEQFEGTGIGLSIVQRIVQRHGGRIWVEAEVDKGATFYFTLPAQA